MKKNLFYYLFAVICTIGLFTSCSDDDEKVVNPIPQTTFNSENGLQLTYNGAPLLGKKVTFTPDATEATKATLRLEGEFDLAGILKGQRSNMTSPTGPGVFPGSPVTTLSVDLSINGNQCTFSGVSETEYCTFSYAGKVTAGTMDLSFTDVTLKIQLWPVLFGSLLHWQILKTAGWTNRFILFGNPARRLLLKYYPVILQK